MKKERKEFMFSKLSMINDELAKHYPKIAERISRGIQAGIAKDKPWFIFWIADDEEIINGKTKSKEIINILSDFMEHLYDKKFEYSDFHRGENKMNINILNLKTQESIIFCANIHQMPEINRFKLNLFACYKNDLIDFLTT